MKIYNRFKNEIIENPNLEIGYLTEDKIIVNIIKGKPEEPEEYHYEYKNYYDENGNVTGTDRVKIIDKKYQPEIPDEPIYEEIMIYNLFTYKEYIIKKIRERYSIDDEIAILRQKDSKFAEYQEYFNYVEECKLKAKQFNLV